VQGAYAAITAFQTTGVQPWPSVASMLAEAAGMREHQELFELHVSDYLLLTRCQEELGHLQGLWGMVERVLGTFAEWYATLWDRINVDELMERTKALAKEVKALHKAVRLYDVFGCGFHRVVPCPTSTPPSA
jgi:hypothetical protein